MTNSSGYITDYGEMLETVLKKKKPKYDLFFYDYIYSQKFGQYLLDLEEWIPKKHIDLYNEKILKDTCLYWDKNKYRLVGLVIKKQLFINYLNCYVNILKIKSKY